MLDNDIYSVVMNIHRCYAAGKGPIRICMRAAVRHMWYDQALGGYDYSSLLALVHCIYTCMHAYGHACTQKLRATLTCRGAGTMHARWLVGAAH